MYEVIKIHVRTWERITWACLPQTNQRNCTVFVNPCAVFLYSTLDIKIFMADKVPFLSLILRHKVQQIVL